MIRFVVIWNLIVTSLLAFLLLSGYGISKKMPLQTGAPQADVLRARRVEVVDRNGRLTAVLGESKDGYAPAEGLTLLDPGGRQAVVLALNDRGYGTLYFSSKQNLGKVSVGYFTGNDEVVPLTKEDPEGGWGIRVRRLGLEPPQIFGVQANGRPIPTSK